MAEDKRLYWIWLQQALGYGSAKSQRLIQDLHPTDVYKAGRAKLQSLSFSGSQLERLCDKSLADAGRILEQMRKSGGFVLTPDDDEYPALLKEIYAPPLVLYGFGQMPDFRAHPAVALVGTRQCSENGAREATALAAGLAAGGMVVVSGGAVGIDAAAHAGALMVGGKTVVVQGCGLLVNYPAQNLYLRERAIQKGSAVITEYPPEVSPSRLTFPLRNRIISGLCVATCVVEAPLHSGALITAGLARDQGRDVFALPGDVRSGLSDGSHELIKQGVRLITRASEILEEYRPAYPDTLDEKKGDRGQLAAWRRLDTLQKEKQKQPAFAHADDEVRGRPAPGPRESGRRIPAPRTDRQPPEEKPVPCPSDATPTAAAIYRLLQGRAHSVTEIAQTLDLPAAEVLLSLTALEMSGCVDILPGQTYALRRMR